MVKFKILAVETTITNHSMPTKEQILDQSLQLFFQNISQVVPYIMEISSMHMVTQGDKDTPVTTTSLWIQNICNILVYREANSLGRLQRHRKHILFLHYNNE